MNNVFKDQIGRNVEAYVDDLIVKSKDPEDHIKDLEENFYTLRRYGMRLNPTKCAFGIKSGKVLGYMVTARGIEANPDKIKAIQDMQVPKNVKDVQRLTGRLAALNRFIAKLAEKCHPFFQLIRKQQNFVWNTECQQAFDQLKLLFTRPPLLDSPRINENLMIYLAVSQKAVSAVLTREDGRLHRPIYYVSHSLHGAEERYTPMEKLAFALIIAARRLRPYFQAHTVEVLTNSALR